MSRGDELRALTGLRGLCALTVVVAHYGFDQYHWIFNLTLWHNPAVDIFFVLSGFTMFYVHGAQKRKLDFYDFIVRRVARLWPLCALTLVLGTVATLKRLGPLGPDGTSGFVLDFLRQLFMVNSWPLVGAGRQFNVPQWSISVEFFLYIFLFPLLYAATGILNGASRRLLLAAMVILMGVSCAFYLEWFSPELTMGLKVEHPALTLLSTTARGICGFTAGCLAFVVSYNGGTTRWSRANDAVSLLFLALLAGASLSWWPYQLLVLLAPAIVMGNVSERSATGWLLASRPLHFLGVISYSMYLLHVPLRWFVALALNQVAHGLGVQPPTGLAVSVVAILVILPLSALSFRFVETPSRQLLYRALSGVPRRPRPAGIP